MENILLDRVGHIKIADFGESVKLTNDEITSGYVPKSRSGKGGTLVYMAPEIFDGDPYTTAVDIWAAGVVLFTMMTGQMPFKINKAKIKDNEPLKMKSGDSHLIKTLIEKEDEKQRLIRQV